MQYSKLQKICLSALFLAVGLLLPLLTGQIKEIGDSLLPMHLPVLLCGLLCGWRYGALVGLLLPPVRSLLFAMPPMYPNALWMAIELAGYGLVIGWTYGRLKKHSLVGLYVCLITAMLAGRAVWGIAKAVLLGVGGKAFTFAAFIAGGFVDAIPGILLQLILIPALMQVIQYVHNK